MSLSTQGTMPGSERTSGLEVEFIFSGFAAATCKGRSRGGDGHHEGETERDDHRPRPDLEEWIPLVPVGEVTASHVRVALQAAPKDRHRRQAV
jgi:hypothetical protein